MQAVCGFGIRFFVGYKGLFRETGQRRAVQIKLDPARESKAVTGLNVGY